MFGFAYKGTGAQVGLVDMNIVMEPFRNSKSDNVRALSVLAQILRVAYKNMHVYGFETQLCPPVVVVLLFHYLSQNKQ